MFRHMLRPLFAATAPTVRCLVLLGLVLVAAALGACSRDVAAPPKIHIASLTPPLSDAQVGEQLVTRRGDQEWHYTVVSAGDLEVVVELVTYMNGAPTGKIERFRWHRNNYGLPDNAIIRRLEPGRIEVGGERWDCWIVHVATNDGRGEYYYWISADVGVHGVLKIARSEGGAPDDAQAISWVSDTLSGRSSR